MQQVQNMDAKDFYSAKIELKQRLAELNNELNIHLAKDYGVQTGLTKKGEKCHPELVSGSINNLFEHWKQTHQPFHWFVEFYNIIQNKGGFDVIIGNPPYVEYSKVKRDYIIRNYQTESCGNMYAFVMERGLTLLHNKGSSSFSLNMRMMYWGKSFAEHQNSNEYKSFSASSNLDTKIMVALFNSSLYFWFWELVSDCWHITIKELENFFLDLDSMQSEYKTKIANLTDILVEDLERKKKLWELNKQIMSIIINSPNLSLTK